MKNMTNLKIIETMVNADSFIYKLINPYEFYDIEYYKLEKIVKWKLELNEYYEGFFKTHKCDDHYDEAEITLYDHQFKKLSKHLNDRLFALRKLFTMAHSGDTPDYETINEILTHYEDINEALDFIEEITEVI